MMRNLICLFIIWIPFIGYAQDTSKSAKQFQELLDEKIPQILHDFSVPGVAIAIIDDGEIAIQKGYGFADVEKEAKVTTKTGFNIASISKTVAAWGIMKLVQEGKVELDAPASYYLTRWQLPASEFNSDEVTIRRLLSHTGGLSLHGYPGWTPRDTLPTIEESLDGKTNGAGAVEIVMEPGTKYQYSGGGYTMLQLIIEEVSGQTFEDYMQKEILNPLGMTNSSFKIDEKIMAASAVEYDHFGEETDFELFTAQAAAGLHTTMEDFTRFAFANLYRNKDLKASNSVLSASILEQMMESAPSFNEGYGLGYERDTRKSMKGFRGHSGGNTGWQSLFRVDPVSNDGFIMFTNGGGGYNIINAILCEWVNWRTGEPLWEGCNIQPSIANKLKQIIDEKGIERIETAYAALAKAHADEYNFAENQLNNLGYFYMAREEIENALAVFKLNMEAFPDGFNVYDSYGEALLAKGEQEAAIVNYTKSIELNPGNGHGIEVLKGLGISTDDLIDKFSIDVGSDVLSGYTGAYQTSTGERLKIQVQEDKISAEIHGKKLNLLAQSAERFIAFGDGAIFSFFTAATGRKGLWTGEKIWTRIPNQELATKSLAKSLVFRNNSSWGRQTDFENVLEAIGANHKLEASSDMSNIELSSFDMIIIPGRQNADYYKDYVSNIERFDEYVKKGGTLLLELNGATRSSITLPRGVSIAANPALENEILASDHPIFLPFSGKSRFWARYSSSGYLEDVPGDARILVVETNGEDPLPDRPTFIEYAYGKGRVIAALQCFHDQDGSGRGPMMESVISYALSKAWENEE